MCGIIGVVLADTKAHALGDLIDGLTALQHRGQDAAGIVTSEVSQDSQHPPRLHLRKDNGLVRDVFKPQQIMALKGNMGIGHVRYPTAGSSSCAEAQPFYTNMPFGVCLAHNGNLTNCDELLSQPSMQHRHVNTGSDSEVMLNVLSDALMCRMLGKQHAMELGFVDNSAAYTKYKSSETPGTPRKPCSPKATQDMCVSDVGMSPDDVFFAVTRLMGMCKGGFAVCVLINGFGLLAFRDPWGIRPISFGSRAGGGATDDYMVASESAAMDTLGFELERDLRPGEALWVSADGTRHTRMCAHAEMNNVTPMMRSCIFEYVYFARPDSIIDGISVYQARLAMGDKLGEKILRVNPKHDIDVVIPVPDTSRTSALQLAYKIGVRYREGFIKNRYIARTFIMPGQVKRIKSVRQKLNPIRLEFAGKNVLLVDDSIVRGTTAREIVQMARDAGANKVYFASAAPSIRHPNVYGIDMPTRTELVAHERNDQQVAEYLKSDWVIYQDLPDLVEAVNSAKNEDEASPPCPPTPTGRTRSKPFGQLTEGTAANGTSSASKNGKAPKKHLEPLIYETSVFDGIYVTEDIDEPYFERLHKKRSDNAKKNKDEDEEDSTSGDASRKKRKPNRQASSDDVNNGMLMNSTDNN